MDTDFKIGIKIKDYFNSQAVQILHGRPQKVVSCSLQESFKLTLHNNVQELN